MRKWTAKKPSGSNGWWEVSRDGECSEVVVYATGEEEVIAKKIELALNAQPDDKE